MFALNHVIFQYGEHISSTSMTLAWIILQPKIENKTRNDWNMEIFIYVNTRSSYFEIKVDTLCIMQTLGQRIIPSPKTKPIFAKQI